MHKYSTNLFIASVLMVAIFADLSTQTDLYDGSLCQLHTGETGVCKSATRCEWLIMNLTKRRMTYADIRRCYFNGANEEVVCCGDEHPMKPTNENQGPCDLGFIFDYNCVSSPYHPNSNPTTSTVPVKPNDNRISGSRVREACAKYSAIATVYFPSSIINGRPAGLSEFPHMVGLGYPRQADDLYDFDCGGSLIADRWVVTAGHCIKDRRKPLIVRMGKITLYDDEDGAEAIDRNIVTIVRHPKYSFTTKRNDIALIEFEGSVEFNDLVRPACIRTDVHDPPESREMIITGWGSIEADKTNRSEILLKANVSSVSLDRCNQTLLQYNQLSNLPSLRALIDSQMCALNLIERSDACQGDSGGPVFLYEQSGVSTIVGIVSFGVSCGTDLPGVYTRIASFVDWIEETVWP